MSKGYYGAVVIGRDRVLEVAHFIVALVSRVNKRECIVRKANTNFFL